MRVKPSQWYANSGGRFLWYNHSAMVHGVAFTSLKIFLVDIIGRLLLWPVWWYSLGFRQLLMALARTVLEEEHRLGVVLWWRNLFVPMYGQSDWQGRIISFFMRLFIGVGRTLVLALWLVLVLAVAAIWLAAPIAAGYFAGRILSFSVTLPWLDEPYGN